MASGKGSSGSFTYISNLISANKAKNAANVNKSNILTSIGTNNIASTNKNTTAASNNPYLDAYNQGAQQIRSNYDEQANAANMRKQQYMHTVEENDAKWRAGQEDLRNAYLENMNNKEANAKQASNAQYDRTASQNYINYRQAEKRLPEQLRNLGMRGGASESSLIRLGTNFNTNVANNEMARAQALDSIAQQYADAIQEYEMQYKQALLSRDDAKANQIASYLDSWNKELADIEASKNESLSNAYMTALQNDIEWRDAQENKKLEKEKWEYEKSRDKVSDTRYEKEYKDAQQSKKLEQYAAGLARYTSVDTLKKMIKNIKKDKKWASDPYKYGKVQAINARIGEIRAK